MKVKMYCHFKKEIIYLLRVIVCVVELQKTVTDLKNKKGFIKGFFGMIWF